jgi:hypothetical protein
MLGRVVQGKVETLGEPRGARRPVLTDELSHAGFEKDPPGSLTERNRPVGGRALARSGPVVYEGTFRRRGPG